MPVPAWWHILLLVPGHRPLPHNCTPRSRQLLWGVGGKHHPTWLPGCLAGWLAGGGTWQRQHLVEGGTTHPTPTPTPANTHLPTTLQLHPGCQDCSQVVWCGSTWAWLACLGGGGAGWRHGAGGGCRHPPNPPAQPTQLPTPITMDRRSACMLHGGVGWGGGGHCNRGWQDWVTGRGGAAPGWVDGRPARHIPPLPTTTQLPPITTPPPPPPPVLTSSVR